jgi:Ca2+-binding RTX toxin-like protein
MGMRRTVLLTLASVASALLLACGVALAATIGCDGGLCVGTLKQDTMTGSMHRDKMMARSGNDSLLARTNNDTLVGGKGDDVLRGQGGDDRYVFDDGWGHDGIPAEGEGSGIDTLDFSALNRAVTADLRPDIGRQDVWGRGVSTKIRPSLTFPSTVTLENARGGSGADSLYGNTRNNTLFGNDGGDRIFGSKGDDTVAGGTGWDSMWGNDDDDKMYGQAGGDIMNGGSGGLGDRTDGNDTMYGGGKSTICGAPRATTRCTARLAGTPCGGTRATMICTATTATTL